jgi:hypothetical protein
MGSVSEKTVNQLPRRGAECVTQQWLVIALTLFVLLQEAGLASAWGRLGHRLTARIAERYLTEKAKAEIGALLEPGESLADASTWADEHRREMPKTAPWHYVDVPLDEARYDDKWAGDEPRKGYIVPKIRELRLVLKDRSRPVEERHKALRFIVHLVGDLHQPLHVGDNHNRGVSARRNCTPWRRRLRQVR